MEPHMSGPSNRATESSAPSADYRDRLQRAVGDRYHLEGIIGEGGMATVYGAEDVKHHRKVAVKVLHETLAHTIGIRRFLQEIEVIAGLQHPHLLTLIDSGEVDGLPYYVMPYLESQSLRERIARERQLPIEDAVRITREVADGLQFAHDRGVIHRDVKPSNILMSGGHAIVADFGIATALNNAAVGRLTETGISLGSPTYMSPEQATAERDLDARTDVYSLGCVLYEMLCGVPPIDHPSMQQAVTRKLTGAFAPVRSLRADVPPALEAAVHKALATAREDRFDSIRSFAQAIDASTTKSGRTISRRAGWMRAAVGLAVAAAILFAFLHQRRVLWASQRVVEIDRLANSAQFAAAFQLAQEVGDVLPRDTTLQRIRPRFTDFIRIVTAPAGARVYRKRLDKSDGGWELIGLTPLDSIPMPKYGWDLSYALRIERDGYNTVDVLPNIFADWAAWRGVPPLDTLRLDPAGRNPGMVRVPGFTIPDTLHPGEKPGTLRFADYYVDRNEITNREYKRFIDAGGYANRDYWLEPFVRDGRVITWDEAMRALRDRSGLHGPSTWTGGTYPEGKDDFPVGGVSYYEAAAYARFAGKQLPTSTHWYRAALYHSRESSWIFGPKANLDALGPRPVGQGVMNPYGMFDVTGNVREWCVNPVDAGRATRGAGWDDAAFFAGHVVARSDFDRSPSNGFRLVALSDADSTVAHLAGRVNRPAPRDYSKAVPVSDAEFRIFQRLFEYDPLPLEARRDTGGVGEVYRWERVSFAAAYGRGRMAAYVFLPKDAKPPYQPVILWPGANALFERSFDPNGGMVAYGPITSFVPRSGRALVLPLYNGTYDRDDSTFSISSERGNTTSQRDLGIQWVKDLRRSIDYLETRPDIDARAVGYFGISWGGVWAPLALAVEPRIHAAALYVGGLHPLGRPLPEVEPVNYLPRVKTPTLLVGGRYDMVLPYESSQLPFVRLLGTPAADKKHVVYSTSHTAPMDSAARETLMWFDKYLGPVDKRQR
jgi:formylglycine-generating enzyme required for sulfatase activity/dienelactone hydrolase/tRNA A-37 threonylcarbamoyl transferase component Bud32